MNMNNYQCDCELSIFPRAVFAGAGLNKVETRGVVMEVATKHSELVLQAFSQSFNDPAYVDVTFIPFTKTDSEYSATFQAAIKQHNIMLHSTRRKVLPELKNLHHPITTKDGTPTTLYAWLSSASDPSVTRTSLVKAVDVTTTNSVGLLYDTDHEAIISKLLKGMHSQLTDSFPASELQHIHDPTKHVPISTPTRSITEAERSWVDAIKRKYLPNPQDNDESFSLPPQKNRKVIYYGPSSKPANLIANTFDPEEKTGNDERLNNIEASLAELKASQSNPPTSNNTSTLIANSVSVLENKLLTKINQNDKKLTTRMDTIETNVANMTTIMTANFAQLSTQMAAILKRLPPESTTPEDGGGKKE